MGETRQGFARIEREVASQRVTSQLEGPPVRACGRDNEEDVFDCRIVSMLSKDPSLGGLQVAQAGLRLERVSATAPPHDRIPRTRIPLPVERDLRAPSGIGGKSRTESPEQSNLGHVTHGISIGVEANTWHESNRGAEAAKLFQPDVTELATLKSPDLAARDTDGTAELVLAQADGDPCASDLSDGVGNDLA